jgi:hypothetical protein
MSQKTIALIAFIAALAAALTAYALKIPEVQVFVSILGITITSLTASLRDSTNVKAARESTFPAALVPSEDPKVPTPPPLPRDPPEKP